LCKKCMHVMILVLALLFAGNTTALADDPEVTLKDALRTETTTSGTPASDTVTAEQGYLDLLKQATDVSEPAAQEVEQVTTVLQSVVSWVVQVLAYAIIACLALRICLDLTFIAMPFTRKFLSNGHEGMQSSNPADMTGYGNDMTTGGYGGYSGYGGYGGRYGSRYGRGYGGYGGASPYGMSNEAMAENYVDRHNIQWVSNAALIAVESETQRTPDGKAGNPYTTYLKDMLAICIIVPVLLLLAITGVLTDLGFALGSVISEVLTDVSTNIAK